MIHFKNQELGSMVVDNITESFISSQHTNHSIALYISILEMEEFGERFSRVMIDNAQQLSIESLNNYADVISGKLSLTDFALQEKELIKTQQALEIANIQLNTEKRINRYLETRVADERNNNQVLRLALKNVAEKLSEGIRNSILSATFKNPLLCGFFLLSLTEIVFPDFSN